MAGVATVFTLCPSVPLLLLSMTLLMSLRLKQRQREESRGIEILLERHPFHSFLADELDSRKWILQSSYSCIAGCALHHLHPEGQQRSNPTAKLPVAVTEEKRK